MANRNISELDIQVTNKMDWFKGMPSVIWWLYSNGRSERKRNTERNGQQQSGSRGWSLWFLVDRAVGDIEIVFMEILWCRKSLSGLCSWLMRFKHSLHLIFAEEHLFTDIWCSSSRVYIEPCLCSQPKSNPFSSLLCEHSCAPCPLGVYNWIFHFAT